MFDLPKILSFVRLLNEFQRVERVVMVNGENRFENDVEHSYNLAMLAWYILENHRLALDKERVLKYALIHDFVEVYAGDTYIYTADARAKQTKKAREQEAAERLKKEIPEFGDLHALIERYEKRSDDESRFVYALDKIQPILHIYTDGGRTWKEKGITIQMLIDNKKSKVALSPEVASCFDEIISLLRRDESKLFNREA